MVTSSASLVWSLTDNLVFGLESDGCSLSLPREHPQATIDVLRDSMLPRSTFATVTNTRDNKFTKKQVFVLADTFVPFWPPYLGARLKAAQHDVQNHLAHIWRKGEEDERGWVGSIHCTLQGHAGLQ